MKQNYSYESAIQPMYRDHLFIAIFGKEDTRVRQIRTRLCEGFYILHNFLMPLYPKM